MPTFHHSHQTELYYEIHGQGYPVVLIAGYTCDSSFWQPILDELSQQFQVIVLDNRGIGKTKDHAACLSAEIMADDVLALIEALDLHKPHIIGQSMGGTIAQMLASHHSEKLGKLVLINTSAKWRQAMLKGLHSLLAMRKNDTPFPIIFESILAWIFGQSFLANQRNIQTLEKLILSDPHPQSLLDQERQFQALKTFDSRHLLQRIQLPTLILHGKEDLLALKEDAEFLARNIVGAKLISLPCAHACIAEVPEQLIDILRDFLS